MCAPATSNAVVSSGSLPRNNVHNPRVAQSATVYQLNIELSDIDRNVYESLSFRVAQHPSEPTDRLVTRILAYTLLYEEGLEFGRGVSDADEPALWTHDLTGALLHWIDVGTPAADRIHLAAKKAPRVTIVSHKTEEAVARETTKRKLHKAEHIKVLLLEPGLVEQIAAVLERKNDWTLVHTDGSLSIATGASTFAGSVTEIALPQ